MSFEVDQTTKQNLEAYEQLVRQAGQINSQLSAWENQFQALRVKVTPDKQAELDARKTQFIQMLRNTLGI